jgi:hypothetical protein
MQNKANFHKGQTNVSFFVTKDYENEPRRRLQENKPNRTQFVFFTVLRAETIASCRIYCYDFIKAE